MRKVKKSSRPLKKILTKFALVLGVFTITSFITGLVILNQTSNIPRLQPAFTSATASNEEPKIEFTVSVVCGGHVVCTEGIASLKKSFKYLESEFNISFKIQNVFNAPTQPEGNLEERWGEWFNTAVRLGAAKNDLSVILVETYPDNVDSFDFQTEGIIGLASGIGVLGGEGPAALIAKVMGSEQFMTRLLIHEIGHTLGAEHIEEGIMHPCACANQYTSEFSLASIKQIKEHLARVQLYRMLSREKPTEKDKEPSTTAFANKSPVAEDMNGMCS